MRRFVAAVLAVGLVSCGGDSGGGGGGGTPTTPSATREIRLEANLDFGEVEVGHTAERILRIYNHGTGPMNVTGMTGPSAGIFRSSWTNGTIQPGASQAATITFAPEDSRTYSGTLTVNGNHTSGTNTIPIRGQGVFRGPRTRFGGGQYLVGTDIAPGRYFTDPDDASCYWERLRGLGGTTSDIIANEFIGFNARQWIVDILPSDRAFEADPECGTWVKDAPNHGAQQTVSEGVWLVGAQIQPGTYRANTVSGCYWERLRNFQGNLGAIISNDFVSSGGTRNVTIRSSDAGFRTDDDCGEWTRTSSLTELQDEGPDELSPATIERNWTLHRQRSGRLQ